MSREAWGNRLASWRSEMNVQYAIDFPAAAKDKEVARQLTINMSKVEVQNKPTTALEYNHFEECFIPNTNMVNGIIRTCRQLSRWCDAYPLQEAFNRYVAPSIYGSARRWMNNFRPGHLIYRVVMDQCGLSKAFSSCEGLACRDDIEGSCHDKDIPRLQPIPRNLARDAILCKRSEEKQEPGVLPMTHATAFDVCVRNGTLLVARGKHMCGWGPGQLQGAGPNTEQADEVLHINTQWVNFGEFAHFVQQLLLPLLPYIDILRDNPHMRLSFLGKWESEGPGKRYENLVQYLEAFGVNRSRLIQAPYQGKRIYVARFVDSGVDQGLLWPARAAAWDALDLIDAPERIVCPGARTATTYSDFGPCVYASQAPEEAAQRYAGAPVNVPDLQYYPMVDVPILLQQRTGRRSITNFDELVNAMQAAIAEWQKLPELARIRITLLMHTDTDEHNKDKALIMKMVAQSRIFVGNHGAGLSLAPLMRPNSAVVEVLSHDPPNYRFSGAVFMISSGRSGLQHHAVMTDKIFPMNDAYVINVPRVINATRNGLNHVVQAENMKAALHF